MSKSNKILLSICAIVLGYGVDFISFYLPRDYSMLGAVLFFGIGPGIIICGVVSLIRALLIKKHKVGR